LQPHYSLVHRAEFERELEPLCLDQGLGVIPYSPLGGGFLTGKYRPVEPLPESSRASGIKMRYMNEKGFAALEVLEAVAQDHDASMAQTSIAWVLASPAVTSAIIGANSIEQLGDTIKGAEVALTADDKAALDGATTWA
jgi:aryl-alcohol dehydrogenase-like predicted oxidoreductase